MVFELWGTYDFITKGDNQPTVYHQTYSIAMGVVESSRFHYQKLTREMAVRATILVHDTLNGPNQYTYQISNFFKTTRRSKATRI